MSVNDLLNLSGWQVTAVEEHEDLYTISALSLPCSSSCPECKSISISKHGKDRQLIHDLPCHAKHVSIVFDRQRYRCRVCKKTWFAPLANVDERRFATSRLVRYVQRQALTRTFVAVAAEIGLDEKTVRLWFADSIATLSRVKQEPTPRIMGLDEIYLLGQPRAVFTNLETHRIIEILPERKKERIGRYLASLGGKDQVQVTVIDMHRPYLDILHEHFPQAQTVIDKFHVVKLVNEIVDRTRKEIHAELTDRQRRGLKHDRYILLKRHHDLTVQQRLLLEAWLGQFPRLAAVYWQKEEFYKVYEAPTYDEAISRYAQWRKKVVESQVFDAFEDFLQTVERWREWIFTYFTHRYTGGPIEGLNSLIRSVDRAGRSYSFAVLRARLLHGQHLLRQTRRPKPKASDVLDVENVGSLLNDAAESTFTQLPLPL